MLADLHAILHFCNQRRFRNEVEKLSLPRVREGDDEQHEDAHLCY